MNKIEKLYKEYNDLKEKLLKNKSLNLKEDYKNKLIELDYAINQEYETKLETDFPMTTTLEKEEDRIERLISFVEEKSQEQKKLINEYKKITGEVIELSYLKYTDNLKSYKERLNNVRRILSIIEEIKNLTENPDNKNEIKLKTVKNRLIKKDLLNLLYEFCLIDNLDVKEIDTNKLLGTNEEITLETTIKEDEPIVESEYIEENIKLEETSEEIIPEIVEEQEETEEEKILTTMPIVEKIGSVVPVNVFESLQKTEEKLPDVVLPTNGLKDEKNDIFVDTKDLFEENEKK